MIDTHAHLALCEGSEAEVVARAREAGLRRILTIGLGAETNPAAVAAAEAHADDGVYAAVGCHPTETSGFSDADAAAIEALAAHPRVVAIGETGLDYYRDRAPRADQRAAFSAQIEIARRTGLALVVHIRDAEMREAVDDAFAVLAAEAAGVPTIIHCFSAPPERVAEAAEHGWYCSFAGNLTYPKSEDLREAARRVPDELLLVETDAPFLAPQPVRGKPNEPARVVETARTLAELRGLSYEELEELVEANAARLFGW